jgi:nitroreductase
MDVLEAIRTRRSVRKYKKEPVPEEMLKQVLESGRWAPSANNSQPWNFIVLRDEKLRKKIAEVTRYGKFLADAPLGIAVVVDPEASTHPAEDGAIATQNMMLAAHALKLGTCWIGSYGSVHEDRVKQMLKIPEKKRLLSIFAIGFPAEVKESKRRGLEEIVFTDVYKVKRSKSSGNSGNE